MAKQFLTLMARLKDLFFHQFSCTSAYLNLSFMWRGSQYGLQEIEREGEREGGRSEIDFKILQVVRLLCGFNKRVYYFLSLLLFGAIFYVGISTSPIIIFVLLVCTISMLFAAYLTSWVLAKDEGPPEMTQVFLDSSISNSMTWTSSYL